MTHDYGDTPRFGGYERVFDTHDNPEIFADVRRQRMFAFLLDATAIIFLTVILSVPVFFLGLFTFGLGWILYPILWQTVALLYTAFTLGGPYSATPGMRAMGLEMRLTNGEPVYPLLAAIHALGYWLSMVFLSPLVLVVSLLNDRKRCLHDIVLNTVILNTGVQRDRRWTIDHD